MKLADARANAIEESAAMPRVPDFQFGFGPTRQYSRTMSKVQIAAELPNLSREDRRELARLIFEMEGDAEVLRDCDRRADERFQMLDAMEAQDGKASAS